MRLFVRSSSRIFNEAKTNIYKKTGNTARVAVKTGKIKIDETGVQALRSLAESVCNAYELPKNAAEKLWGSFEEKRSVLGPHAHRIERIVQQTAGTCEASKKALISVALSLLTAAQLLANILGQPSLGTRSEQSSSSGTDSGSQASTGRGEKTGGQGQVGPSVAPLFDSCDHAGKFVPLLETRQEFENVLLNGQMVTIFDHPFAENTARICNQGSAYPNGPTGTCGCCSCGSIINKAGGHTDEHEVVAYAWDHHLCDDDGGTSPENWVSILSAAGIPATSQRDVSLSELAKKVEQGHGVIIGVSACTYCPEMYGHYIPGIADGHALVLESVVRNTAGEVVEYVVCDSNGDSSRSAVKRIAKSVLEKAFQKKGGLSAVTTDIIW